MRAMVLEQTKAALKLAELPVPMLRSSQLLIRVEACGVCRTDLHICDGELKSPKLPLVPGHEIVGSVVETGPEASGFRIGDRVGVPWLGSTCDACRFCLSGRENLCEDAQFTGYTIDGGYAEYTVAEARYCFPLSRNYSAVEAAPLFCAGLIGFRAWRMTTGAQKIGFYGFGASAHILAQIARAQGKKIFAFVRPGDEETKDFALSLGAYWAGASDRLPPEPLDAAIIFAPAGPLVPMALRALDKGGKLICAGIHMSDIPSFPYELLWHERSICSVANLTRQDGIEFFNTISTIPVQTETVEFPLDQANEALDSLRRGAIKGAAVLKIS